MAKQEDKIQEEITQEEMDAQTTASAEEQVETPQEPTWEEKYNELNDKYLRLYSDFDNFRKRNIKEKADLISNAGAGVIKDLLPILDDFERAIKSNASTEDATGLKEGFELIANKMNNILNAKGLKMMESKETPFDADLHEAITNIPAPTEELKGKVVDVIENGYYLNDKVLRYAKVVVGQ